MSQLRSKLDNHGSLKFQKVAHPTKAKRKLAVMEPENELDVDEEDAVIPDFAGAARWPPRYPFEDIDEAKTEAEWLEDLNTEVRKLQKKLGVEVMKTLVIRPVVPKAIVLDEVSQRITGKPIIILTFFLIGSANELRHSMFACKLRSRDRTMYRDLYVIKLVDEGMSRIPDIAGLAECSEVTVKNILKKAAKEDEFDKTLMRHVSRV